MKIEVNEQQTVLTIRLAILPEPRPSKNSKGTFIVATSGGLKPAPLVINGNPVMIAANAFYKVDDDIPADDGVDGAEKPADDGAKNTESTGTKTKKK